MLRTMYWRRGYGGNIGEKMEIITAFLTLVATLIFVGLAFIVAMCVLGFVVFVISLFIG